MLVLSIHRSNAQTKSVKNLYWDFVNYRMAIIGQFYKSIKSPEALLAIPERIKKLSENCVTLLDDE